MEEVVMSSYQNAPFPEKYNNHSIKFNTLDIQDTFNLIELVTKTRSTRRNLNINDSKELLFSLDEKMPNYIDSNLDIIYKLAKIKFVEFEMCLYIAGSQKK